MLEFGSKVIISVALLRVIRIIRFNAFIVVLSPTLRLGLQSFSKTKYVAINLFMFFLLISYIYALIGTAVFGRVAKIFPINYKVSFHTVWRSIVLLYQVSTLAGWDGVYKVLVKDSETSAFIIASYLLSYIFVCIFILTNLVITVTLNFYSQICEVEEKFKLIKASDLQDFNDKWNTMAQPDQPNAIEKSMLIELLNQLQPHSDLCHNLKYNVINVKLIDIPLRDENYYYKNDVLNVLNKIRLRKLYYRK